MPGSLSASLDPGGKRVLVTGSTGFIGSRLTARLLALGCRVIAHTHRRPLTLSHPHLSSHSTPLHDPEAVRELFARVRPEWVVNLAGVRPNAAARPLSPDALFQINQSIVQNLLHASAEHAVEAFLQAGTSEEYGDIPAPFEETAAVRPLSGYGSSKLAAALAVRHYARESGLNAATARIFLAYGTGQEDSFFLPQLLAALHSGRPLAMSPGEQTRDFVWVDDCIEALVRLLRCPQLEGEPFNVCTGVETSLLQVVALLAQLAGRPIPVEAGRLPYRAGELMRNYGSPEKLQRITGFRPATPLAQGLRLLLDQPPGRVSSSR